MGRFWKKPLVDKLTFHSTGETVEQFGQSVTLDTPAVAVHIHGGFVLVDEQDVCILQQRRWNMAQRRKTAYCIYNGRLERFKLHRVLVVSDVGIDHINRAGWDNRRANLRESTAAENSRNHGPNKNKKHSRFKGVTYDDKKCLFRARIMVDGKSIGLGRFKSEENAARAYNNAAKIYHGDFACVNHF